MHEDEVEKGVFVSSHNITLKHFSTSHALAFCWSWSRLKCTHSQRTNTHCHVEDIKWGLWECVTWIRHCPRLSTSFGKIKNEWKCLLWRIDAFPRKIPRRVKNPVHKAFWGWDFCFGGSQNTPSQSHLQGGSLKNDGPESDFLPLLWLFYTFVLVKSDNKLYAIWAINFMSHRAPIQLTRMLYVALWRCSSSIELLFFVPHTSIACV